jgi:Cdc6-like AAA superfamily ATPase
VDNVIYHIFDSILKDTYNQTIYSKISDFFKNHIQAVDLFGINIAFKPNKGELEELKMNFPQVLKNIITKINGERKGLFIILDDIDGLAKNIEFADWYKSFVDYVATHFNNQFSVTIMTIGLPEQKDSLGEQQPSLLRIFRPIHIDTLSEDEVRSFFKNTFEKVNIKIDEDAMKLLVEYSSGLPSLMQEIGDAIYWKDVDHRINKVDAMVGIATAADQVGQKYLDPKVFRTIRSDNYKKILNKIGRQFSSHFKKKDIERHLTESEKKVFHNFLSKMTELGVIMQDKEQGLGSYKFENELYALYFYIVSVGNLTKK